MKVLLSIQYDGKNYYGWQEQKTPDTVQGKLQEAIYKFCQEKVKIYEFFKNRKKQKKFLDKFAARIILEDFFNSNQETNE